MIFVYKCEFLFQERYKNDMNLAIQLLQCKPDNFVSQKLDNVSQVLHQTSRLLKIEQYKLK